MIINKKTFKVTVPGKNGEPGIEQEFAVLRPNTKIATKAQQVHSRAFRDSIDAGALVRSRIDRVMRDQNLWDDAREAEFSATSKRILANERKLALGGIKKSEARELALQMSDDRSKVRSMLVERNNLDQHTAESQAENVKFNFLVSACTVFAETGKPYFKDFDDYSGRDNDPVADEAALQLSRLLYNLDDDHQKNLPEAKFLAAHGFVDSDLRLIDKSGNFIDRAGRRVNKEGQLINEKNELIDSDGNLLTATGDYLVEFKPFLEDDGTPDAVSALVTPSEPVVATPFSAEQAATTEDKIVAPE